MPEISTNLTEQLRVFMENADSARLSKNLRNLLLEHLVTTKDGHCFNLDDLLTDLIRLFDFLEAVEENNQ